jgi:cobalt-zinc-cadmium resistance protein CzcA
MAGARADLSLKIYGDDFAQLERLAMESLRSSAAFPAAATSNSKPSAACPCWRSPRSAAPLQRLGLHADEINGVVATALGGRGRGLAGRGQPPHGVVVRLPEAKRLDHRGLRELPVLTAADAACRCRSPASPTSRWRTGWPPSTREDTQRRVAILVNVRGRDTEGFVREAAEQLRARLKPPAGYYWNSAGSLKTSRPRARASPSWSRRRSS